MANVAVCEEKSAEKKEEVAVEPKEADGGPDKKQDKRGIYSEGYGDFGGGGGDFGGHDWDSGHHDHDHHHVHHHEKTVHVIKKVPQPYPVVKHVPVPIHKTVSINSMIFFLPLNSSFLYDQFYPNRIRRTLSSRTTSYCAITRADSERETYKWENCLVGERCIHLLFIHIVLGLYTKANLDFHTKRKKIMKAI